MKDFAAKVVDFLALDHVIITLFGLLAALLTSARNDVGLPILARSINVLTGFSSACLAGFILHEYGWAAWLSSGVAYLTGYLGNRLMSVLLVVLKQAEIDPFSTAGKIIGLIWSWKLPVQSKNDGRQ
ncbi:hypothetical protein [Spirosoma areae]